MARITLLFKGRGYSVIAWTFNSFVVRMRPIFTVTSQFDPVLDPSRDPLAASELDSAALPASVVYVIMILLHYSVFSLLSSPPCFL